MTLEFLTSRAAGAVTAILVLAGAPAAADEVTVFAAASTRTALDEIAAAWAGETGHRAVMSYAGSSALARQIEAGAPADLFISANVGWMDALEAQGLIRRETRTDLIGNTLVLIGHGPEAAPVALAPGLDLAAMLGDERLAMALVEAVPAGIYGKAALQALGAWDEVAPRVAQADNARAALALVSTGEAPMGIVYATDARADPNVTVLGTFPPASHPPVVYPAAITADSASPVAEQFLAFLAGPTARAAWERQGFGVTP